MKFYLHERFKDEGSSFNIYCINDDPECWLQMVEVDGIGAEEAIESNEFGGVEVPNKYYEVYYFWAPD